MGNCLAHQHIVVPENEPPQQITMSAKETTAAGAGKEKRSKRLVDGDKKKVVRFKLPAEAEEHNNNNDNADRGSGRSGESKNGSTVRIRLVVTQDELKQILRLSKEFRHSSLEQLITAAKLSATSRVSHHEAIHGGWRPALESIPEGHYN